MLNSLLVFAKRGGATPHLTPPEYTPFEKFILQKRALIETVIGQLKMIYELEHTRHRCLTSLMIHFGVLLHPYSGF
jgi:hypothetical protein